jgi:hypothetical protein
MKNKFKIIETADYILAVSDEEIIKGDFVILTNNEIIEAEEGDGSPKRKCKIIAYQPKENAPELDLPLLPEIVVKDDVEKLAIVEGYKYYPYNDINSEFALGGFIRGYKSATKRYSEGDLDNAIDWALEMGRKGKVTFKDIDEFIHSLNQPKTPKWFVAENNYGKCMEERCLIHPCDSSCKEVKTTTTSGKAYLVGTYLYE